MRRAALLWGVFVLPGNGALFHAEAERVFPMNHTIHLKKQLRCIYLSNFFSGLRITDAVWVALLAARGFSLWEIGLAESVYHIVSLLCEVPSGMAADLLGRKRALVAGGILAVLSSLLMAFAPGLFLICAAMGLNALSNTMFSGTDAALTYDSLKQAGQEERYLSVAANRSQIGMLASALGSLASTLRRFYTVCALLVGGGTFLVGAAPAWGGILGMMLVQGVLEVWLLHADQRLNALISSDQRATLISVDSMAYSILMIPASPFVGAVGDLFGQAGAGLALLGVLTAASGAAVLAKRRS